MVWKRNFEKIHVCRLARDSTGFEDPLDVVGLNCRAGATREMVASAGWRKLLRLLITFQKVGPEVVVGVVTDGGLVRVVWRRIC